ncbi:unnamed protein product [Ranitomeya imitator]|uniref:Adrenomedullin n=1 Tax=Ranitomeya imitator TaxID=111125 RepID=A0ABN9L1P1_9NEOB|nr:unnamed protein product [Ranitomeya imitator]
MIRNKPKKSEPVGSRKARDGRQSNRSIDKPSQIPRGHNTESEYYDEKSPDGEDHLQESTTMIQPILSTPMADLMTHLRSLRRKRRRARRLHQPRLMRVGCSLGTCQVQNLNHRLWQLLGQIGKEDSPIQLSNPHSFG